MRGRCSLRCVAAVLWLALASGFHAGVSAQEAVRIETTGQGDLITVNASADMQVEARTVWDVITDYERLAEFIPDMSTSHVVQRHGDTLLVEQTGQFRFLMFEQAVDVRMEVVESPHRLVVARAVGGNVKELEGRYAIESLPTGGVRLAYAGRLIPAFPMPPILGNMVVRRILSRQFTALVQEIERRDGLARGGHPP
jgi:ribosome-associated toxin RatA of RatAB toxin-antitoxin module